MTLDPLTIKTSEDGLQLGIWAWPGSSHASSHSCGPRLGGRWAPGPHEILALTRRKLPLQSTVWRPNAQGVPQSLPHALCS